MPFIDESKLDPLPSGQSGRIITEAELDPIAPTGENDFLKRFQGNLVTAANTIFPYADEAAAGIRSIIPGYQSYDKELQAIRSGRKEHSRNFPNQAIASSLIGALATAPFLPTAIGTKASLGAKAAQAAKEGMAYGAFYGAGEGEGGLSNRAEEATRQAAIGGLLAPAASVFGDRLSVFGKTAKREARALDRKSVGAMQLDYGRATDNLPLVAIDEEEIGTRTRQALDEFLSTDKLGTTRNAQKLLTTSREQQYKLAQEVDTLVRNYDNAGNPPVFPTFEKSLNYLSTGKVPANKIDNYLNRIDDMLNGMRREGKGKLEFLQQQKIAVGKDYNARDKVEAGFVRMLYRDIREAIDNAVPEIAPLNEQLEKYELLKPILQRSFIKSENRDTPRAILQAIVATHNPKGLAVLSDIADSLGSSSLKHAPFFRDISPRLLGLLEPKEEKQSRQADARTQRAYQRGSSQATQTPYRDVLSSNKAFLSPDVHEQALSPEAKQSTTPNPLTSSNTQGDTVIDPKSKSQFGKLLDAIKYVESRGNANAVSKAGAKGAYQLMDPTGKEYHKKLGISEPYDPHNETQARQIAAAIIRDYARMFDGDIEKAVLAYHSGPANVRKGKIGPQGKAYVPAVERALAKILKA